MGAKCLRWAIYTRGFVVFLLCGGPLDFIALGLAAFDGGCTSTVSHEDDNKAVFAASYEVATGGRRISCTMDNYITMRR